MDRDRRHEIGRYVVLNTGSCRARFATLGPLARAVIGIAVLAAPLKGQSALPVLGEVTAARIVRADASRFRDE
jgi:hypothetical protein